MRTALHQRHGFTLVELVLTIVILGVISFVALPRFFNQATFDERFFYDDIVAASRYASKLAVGSGCSVRLSVNASGYALTQDGNCNYTSPDFNVTVVRPDENISYANNDIPDSLTLSSSESTLIFRPNHQVVNGAGSAISTATIQLTGERVRQIIIYGGSGFVQEG